MMKIELNGIEVELEEDGTIKTWIGESYPKIVDEFYPAGNVVQTQIDNIIVQPNTYKKRVINYKDKEYLKRQIRDKNRTRYNIAKDFNVSESSIRPYVKKHNIETPLEDEEYLEKLHNEKDSIDEIADEIDRPSYKVKIALEQKGIIDPPYANP